MKLIIIIIIIIILILITRINTTIFIVFVTFDIDNSHIKFLQQSTIDCGFNFNTFANLCIIIRTYFKPMYVQYFYESTHPTLTLCAKPQEQ